MRKLVPLRQVIDEAEQMGENLDCILIDPDDVCSVDSEELSNPDDELEEEKEQ